MEICKIAFFCEYQYLGFFKSQHFFRGFRIQFCFQILTPEVENAVLSKKVKTDFLEKNAIFDQKLRFLRVFQSSQLKLRNSSFKQNGLFLHQIRLRNSILIKLKYCLSILEILDFALLRYPKRAGTRTSARVFF